MRRVVKNYWVEIIIVTIMLLVAGGVIAGIIEGKTSGGATKTVLVESDGTVDTKIGAGAGTSVTTPLYVIVSDDTTANSLANPMFVQISQNGTNAMTTTHPMIVSATDAANLVTNPIFTQPSNGTNGVDILAASADNVAWTNNPMVSYCVMAASDGAASDMLTLNGSGYLNVVDATTRPGENAGSNWRTVEKGAIVDYHPAKTTTTTIGTAKQTVLGPYEVLGYPNFCIWLSNNDDTDPLTDMDIEVSPDNFATASSTVALTEISSCDTLATGVGCVGCYANNGYRYVRVRVAAADANQVSSLDAWITANVN